MHWLYLAVAITAEVIATSALKASEGFTRTIPSVVVAIGYGVAFYFLSLTLKTLPVGVAYAVWSGLGVVLVSLVGYIFLGQSLDFAGCVGIGLIVAGVAVLNLFSTAAAH
jgi:small multidrug resistance pump